MDTLLHCYTFPSTTQIFFKIVAASTCCVCMVQNVPIIKNIVEKFVDDENLTEGQHTYFYPDDALWT